VLDSIYRETISEALLRRAVIQDHENELAAIPPEDELRKMYTFSPQHEARMKTLFQKEKRRENKIVIFTALRRAAVVVAVIGSLLLGLLLSNSEVRAKVWTVMREWFEGFTRYSYNQEYFGDYDYDIEWTFDYLPDGYAEREKLDMGPSAAAIFYTDADGNEITFQYSPAHEISFGISNEHTTFESIVYNGLEYDVYTAISDEYPSRIIWVMDNYAMNLTGYVEVDELLRMAQSVTPK